MSRSHINFAFSNFSLPELTQEYGRPCSNWSKGFRLSPPRTSHQALFATISGSFHSSLQRRRPQEVFSLARLEAAAKPNNFRVVTIAGDGRCMFRALARGLSFNKGVFLNQNEETNEADALRLAVVDVLCRGPEKLRKYKEVLPGVNADGGILRYCPRLRRPEFWGGDVELTVLSKLLQVPIFIYTEQEGSVERFRILTKFGEEYARPSRKRKGRWPVRLLYKNGNHYDLLL